MAHRKDEHGLTDLWRKLCDAVLANPDKTATELYQEIRKCSNKTAQINSSRILNRVECKAYLAMRREEVSQQAVQDAAWLRDRLGEELEADILDLYHEDGSFKPVRLWPKIFRKGLVTEVEHDADGNIKKLKLVDRGKRIELFGRHCDVSAWDKAQSGAQEVTLVMVAPE